MPQLVKPLAGKFMALVVDRQPLGHQSRLGSTTTVLPAGMSLSRVMIVWTPPTKSYSWALGADGEI